MEDVPGTNDIIKTLGHHPPTWPQDNHKRLETYKSFLKNHGIQEVLNFLNEFEISKYDQSLVTGPTKETISGQGMVRSKSNSVVQHNGRKYSYPARDFTIEVLVL